MPASREGILPSGRPVGNLAAMNDASAFRPSDVALPVPLPRLAGVLAQAERWAGPVALILAEDSAELASTLRHHREAGFGTILLCLPEGLEPPQEPAPGAGAGVIAVRHDPRPEGAVAEAVNAVIAAVPDGTWIYYGHNAEYLFHPFCETRNVRELLAFHAEERREAMFACVIDLYPAGNDARADRLDRSNTWLDGAGYFSLPRKGPDGAVLDRQVEVHGGLRWRFDDHVAPERRRIDRIPLFRARKGLRLLPDHRFSEAEYNTCSCPWHHNLTACILSLRAAKALKSNPVSREAIHRFDWSQSVRFDWSSQKLMDLGLMEPGQWF